jgi:hypothetical protein
MMPVKAIFLDDEVPAQWKHFIQLNANRFQPPLSPPA